MGGGPKDEDPVFATPSGKRLGSVKKSLSELLKAAGLLTDHRGARRTAYSFRHFYISPSYSPRRAKIGANSQTSLCWQQRNSITCLGTCVTLWVKRRRRGLSTGCFDSSLATTRKLSCLSE